MMNRNSDTAHTTALSIRSRRDRFMLATSRTVGSVDRCVLLLWDESPVPFSSGRPRLSAPVGGAAEYPFDRAVSVSTCPEPAADELKAVDGRRDDQHLPVRQLPDEGEAISGEHHRGDHRLAYVIGCRELSRGPERLHQPGAVVGEP